MNPAFPSPLASFFGFNLSNKLGLCPSVAWLVPAVVPLLSKAAFGPWLEPRPVDFGTPVVLWVPGAWELLNGFLDLFERLAYPPSLLPLVRRISSSSLEELKEELLLVRWW